MTALPEPCKHPCRVCGAELGENLGCAPFVAAWAIAWLFMALFVWHTSRLNAIEQTIKRVVPPEVHRVR